MESQRIRWGILSTGRIAQVFAQSLTTLPEAQLHAIGSRSAAAAEAFGTRFNVPRRHASYAALARDEEVDVIYIGTPHSLHAENCLLCLEAGKAVLCEKPLTINAAEAERVIEFARQKQLFLMEAMWTRFLPALVQAREWLANGMIGEPRLLLADFGFHAAFDPKSRLFAPALGGGALLDVGIYPLALASMIFGPPQHLTSMAHLGATGVDEQCAVILGYPGGQLAVLAAANRTDTPKEATIIGTAGSIKLHSPFFKTTQVTLKRNGQTEQTVHAPYESFGYQHEAAEVMACLRAGRLESEIMPLDESLQLMQNMDEIRRQWGLRYPQEINVTKDSQTIPRERNHPVRRSTMGNPKISTAIFLSLLVTWHFALAQPHAASDTTKAPAKKADKKDWDVTAAHGPTKEITFTTHEGTWMNLDVSPDGKEIVFDLLGDIYLMPIAGGEAKLLRGGPAFEVQPRFSPDGRQISFTSDAGGGDNIWVMQRDGSKPRQVTKEDFRLLNNAVWTPDGNYLIARKHFTSTRSLGAGEMWLYHLTGGEGLQLTKRKNDQQDAGEAAVSPDGRYVYFSEDMSGGDTFQYNKDPNGQIYVIRRLDRDKGELKNYVTGAGGAVRPQPSPDGKYLAFVRRVRLKTVLYLQDLKTGEQIPIYDGLNKDQQETWATFGVYPNYAWTPDSRQIVIWAQGKIWRIDIASRQAIQIPFTVKVKQTVTAALHFPQTVHADSFTVKMIRDAVISPDGKTLVFSAVGSLWKKALPNGKPQRLTNSALHEFFPSFSPDGLWIVYATWSDTALGGLYKVKLDGRNPVKLTRRKGYYLRPSFSPDGKKLVYQRAPGNSILGFAYGVEPGLYWMAAEGGEEHFIQEEGYAPRFNRSGDRIFFLTGSGLDKKYKSVRLDGGEERTHFNLKYVNQIVPSPDQQWVAFTELFNAYIAPFPQTGGPIELSSNTKALPVKRVTRDAGNYLHWSGDSQKLYWLIGPELFSRELRQSFTFLPGAPDSVAGPDSVGLQIGLRVKTDVPPGKLAFLGARLITMRGDEVIENGALVVEGNRITALGRTNEITIPADAKRIDAAGKTIMPGLIDVHAHADHFFAGLLPQQSWAYFANLAYGVTTMHDPSANTETVFTLAEMVAAGRITGPRVYSTGTILYGADGDFKAVINNLDDARSHLRRLKAVGAFSVKSYNQPRRNQRQQVLQAARELNMLVMPEGGSFFYHNMSMVIDGHTGIEHSIPIAPVYQDVLSLWGATTTAYTPTLIVGYGGIWGENYWYQKTHVWEKRRLLTFTPRPIIDARARRRMMIPDDDFGHIGNAQAAKALSNAGVKVNLGAHGQLQGLGAHWELWMLAQGGMTPLEAIRAATLNGAEYLGMARELGSLEVGKLADLIVLEKNPLENIQNTEFISLVMKNGRLYHVETMNEIGNVSRPRLPFYWENAKTSEAFVWKGAAVGFGEVQCGCLH